MTFVKSIVQNGLNFSVVNVGLVVVLETGVNDFWELFAVYRGNGGANSFITDTNWVLRV